MTILLPEQFGVMRSWVDAYGATLEANAEAAANPVMRRQVNEVLREAKMDVVQLGTDRAHHRLVNQQAVADRLGAYNHEAVREIRTRWMSVREQLLSLGWDLREEVHFIPSNGRILVWQGTSEIPPADAYRFAEQDAKIIIGFLDFVRQNTDQGYDPRKVLRGALSKQGITKENFHLYEKSLQIANPWEG